LSGNTQAGILSPSICPGSPVPNRPTAVQAAYIEKHGTCSYTEKLQPILSTIDQKLYQGIMNWSFRGSAAVA
jgi:hypothetical protein